MFPPGKSGQKIWGFEISHFPVSSWRDPGKSFYTSKEFSGTDIYQSDLKNALVLRSGVKSILKLYLSKSIVTDGETTRSKVESID